MSAPSNLRRAASHGGEPKVQGQSGTEAPPRTVKRTRPEDPAEDPGLEREECTRHSQADPRIRRVLAVGYETRIARGHCSEKGKHEPVQRQGVCAAESTAKVRLVSGGLGRGADHGDNLVGA